MSSPRLKIAIVGSGVSGLTAAWALSRRHDITLFEKDARLGGHVNTARIDYDGQDVAVDTGFIVFNNRNYPNLTTLFDHLGVECERSDMAFSLSRANGREWSSDGLAAIFAHPGNLASPSFIAMLSDIARFNIRARLDFKNDKIGNRSLHEYLSWRGFGPAFWHDYLGPMGAAIWSMSAEAVRDFPAGSFIQFFNNHRLTNFFQPYWRTVRGGATTYVEKLTESFSDRIEMNCGVSAIYRRDAGVELVDQAGRVRHFDHVVLACHSDQALALLKTPHRQETDILSRIRYAPNRAVLHRDVSLMPRVRRAWASWNYLCEGAMPKTGESPVSLTYYMNRLQNIDPRRPLFVTLNPKREIRQSDIFGEYQYDHPQFDIAAIKAQKMLPDIQGVDRIWYAGAYWGYGFHEDGAASGLRVAKALGADIPWTIEDTSPQPSAPANDDATPGRHFLPAAE